MAHILTMQYFINIAEEQCGADWLAAVARFCHLWVIGCRQAGGDLPVTPDTVFQVASVSKPLTSTVLAALVGEQKVDWDTPVNELDPQFQLSDPWVTKQLTLKDLLSHRSGLPDHAGDLLEDLGFDQQSIMQKLRLEPLKGFRSNYAYTNFGFTEAALAAAKASNMSWKALVQEKLLNPLGMTATSTTFQGYLSNPNKADIHFISKGKAEPLQYLPMHLPQVFLKH